MHPVNFILSGKVRASYYRWHSYRIISFDYYCMCTFIFRERMILESGLIRDALVESMTPCKTKPLLKHEQVFSKLIT